MRHDDCALIISDLFEVKHSLDCGMFNENTLGIIDDRLFFLNACIDAMEAIKTKDDLILIGIAYQYFRQKERFFKNEHEL
jgi:hypothetical protein